MLVPSRPWPEIEAFYAALPDAHPFHIAMREIVRYLRRPPFESALFGATSMFSLCIARTKVLRWGDAMLRIEPGRVRGDVVFAYLEHPPAIADEGVSFKEPWSVTVASSEAVERLDRILFRRLRWFKETDG